MSKTNAASKITDAPSPVAADPGPSRTLAALIDLVAVALPTMVVAMLASERFEILDELNGSPRFSEVDQLRINEIDAGFNRAVRVGQTVLTLSGSGWWLTMLVLVALTVTIFVIVPSKLRMRTPGKLILGMPAPTRSTDDDESDDQVAVEIVSTSVAEVPAALRKPTDPRETATDDVAHAAIQETGERGQPLEQAEALLEATVDALSGEPTTAAEPPIDEQAAVTNELPAGPVSLAENDDYIAWDRQQSTDRLDGGEQRPATSTAFGQLALAESSLAENPIHASTAVASATTATATATATADTNTTTATTTAAMNETATAATATAEAPIWSDQWQAWLYWDPGTDSWFRHDSDQNKWRRLS